MYQQEKERIVYHPKHPIATLVLAHGAGAGNQHEFIQSIAKQLCDKNILVISFNFPYMQQMYLENKRKPPNKMPILLEHFEQEVQFAIEFGLPIFLAGKSMGGRVASVLNTNGISGVKGAMVYGYPFIPPGKPEKLEERTLHLPRQQTPLMIVQGERDTFGGKELISKIQLPEIIDVHWIIDGDHSYKPRKSASVSLDDNIACAVLLSEQFINNNI